MHVSLICHVSCGPFTPSVTRRRAHQAMYTGGRSIAVQKLYRCIWRSGFHGRVWAKDAENDGVGSHACTGSPQHPGSCMKQKSLKYHLNVPLTGLMEKQSTFLIESCSKCLTSHDAQLKHHRAKAGNRIEESEEVQWMINNVTLYAHSGVAVASRLS